MACSARAIYAWGVLVIFSDLDGTLLDPQSYDWRAARPALEALEQRGIPLVLVSSKTRAELEFWRARISNRQPFVVENGGAVFIPAGYFSFPLSGAVERGGYQVIELGRRYAELVEALKAAARESGVKVSGFHSMTVRQVSLRSNLPPAQARLAKQREYDEPFEIQGAGSPELLLEAIRRRGLRCTRGGRFYHITGDNDKAAAVQLLIRAFRQTYGEIHTVGLGDACNDLGLLNLMDTPVIVASPHAEQIRLAIPRARLIARPGPEGWNEAVLEILSAQQASKVIP